MESLISSLKIELGIFFMSKFLKQNLNDYYFRYNFFLIYIFFMILNIVVF